ncbi:MAG: ParB/RepB/Spo0J family partition protein [Clostridia bacterium]|nr:ParB/RepB/Spo0J family partition protein [Clostridia bacterium]
MAKAKKSGLGGGLNALFSQDSVAAVTTAPVQNEGVNAVFEVNINSVEPGDGQPRKSFDKEKIEQLAESIKEHGIIQPIIVSKSGNSYKIIAGERRWRAARVAGLKKVPVIEKEVTDRQILEMALIENIQREDLNPIEEAEAYSRLVSEYNMTQEELSKVVSKSRSAVANTMRLLGLSKNVRAMVISGELSEGHARCLLSVEDAEKQLQAAKIIIENGYNVRQTENFIKQLKKKSENAEKDEQKEKISDNFKIAVEDVQNRLKSSLGTKVKLMDKGGKGKIVIDYYSAEERERLIKFLTKE